jgi:uncharacterized membrane protein YraQ (UPF0718 family)
MVQLHNGITLFFSLLVEALPFLLLGVIFSSVLLLFVDEQRLLALVPQNVVLAALAGSLIGFLFPVCECGNIPVARRLLMKGAPTALTIGFLLAAPTVNPVVFWATWIAFRDQPEIVFLRVGFTLLIAVTIALVFSRQEDLRPFLQDNLTRLMTRPAPAQPTGLEDDSPLLRSGTFLLQAPGQVLQLDANPAQVLSQATTLAPSWRARWGLMVDNMVLEMRELGAVLVLGSLGGVHLFYGGCLFRPLLFLPIHQWLPAGLSGVWADD